MGATYTRQSTYTDGDIIQASNTNNEFDQLLAAFAASTGHSHDGTTGEGGPVTKLLGTGITIGDGSSGTDITVTFDGESNDGVLKWMEDEDYFEFSDDILMATTEKLQFRDTGLYINSSADGQLDIVADTEIQIAATTVDINGLVDISGNLSVGGNLDVTGTFDLSDSNFTNAGDIQLDSISGDADTNTSITFSGSDVITIATGGSTAATFNASQALTLSGILDITDATDASDATGDTGALRTEGGASIAKKLYVGTDLDVSGASTLASLTVSGATTLAATSFGDADITNVGSIALDTITNDGTDVTVDSSGDIILDADGGDVFVKDAGTTFGSLTNSSGNLVIKSGTTTALTFSGANATLAGDLTIGGDDLTMATNTAGALLIADGTNFNPTVVGDLSEIATAANDDVFIAIDTSGGGLKKISRSAIIAGTGSSGDLANIVEDTSPQLGGNLDTNSNNILIDDAHFIGDENGNEQIIFQTTSSAVNQIDVTNAATGNGPIISSTGGDTNINLNLTPKGSGVVMIDGTVGIDTGKIDLKNSGTASQILFYCESSNAHAQTLQGAPHSQGATNTLLLPDGGNGTLLSTVSTATITNKTLTSPKINEDVAVTSTATELNLLDGVTATTAELNILDGVTSTAAEINIIDGGTSATSTTVADADRVVMNDNGTMVQVAVTDLAAYFDDEITAMPNLITTAATTVGALDSGSITSGFGTIDTGASAITTTGLISGGSLDIDNVLINGTTIGHTDDTDLITLADGLVTVAGEVSLTTLDIGGTNVTSTAAELNILDGVTATAAELNLLDGGTSVGSSITVADADGFVVNDGGTMKTIPATDIKTYAAGSAATKGFAIAMAIVFG